MFSAYLQTYRGIVESNLNGSNLIIWTYKKKKVNTKTIEEYNNIENAINDTWLCNGVRDCKRVYDDKNKVVITYIPPYDELYKKEYDRSGKEFKYALENNIEEYNIEKILTKIK